MKWYEEILITWFPVVVLGWLFYFSISQELVMLALISAIFLLAKVTMESMVKRRSADDVSFDLLSAQLYSKVSFSLILTGIILSVILGLQEFGFFG